MRDILAEPGMIFLGSRLKRLSERFQAGASSVLSDLEIELQVAHLPLLAALYESSMTVGQLADAVGSAQPGITRSIGQLVDLGLVRAELGEDRRKRHLQLTAAGMARLEDAKARLWPLVAAAMDELCAPLSNSFENDLRRLENALDAEPLDRRILRAGSPLRLLEFSEARAADFRALNLEWIEDLFTVEGRDRDVLDNPRERILDPGGAILFVAHDAHGVIGSGALQRSGENRFELTKMAVSAKARGMKAGEFLLRALLDRARDMGAREVYLLSNWKCAAAVHLYEKVGFLHDADIMREHGADYVRCDVAMRYRLPAESTPRRQ
jgi:N-acetylglutamate synthase-like GNAT family acetyltransferase/DNA-binding MarR family transcriptional regulator